MEPGPQPVGRLLDHAIVTALRFPLSLGVIGALQVVAVELADRGLNALVFQPRTWNESWLHYAVRSDVDAAIEVLIVLAIGAVILIAIAICVDDSLYGVRMNAPQALAEAMFLFGPAMRILAPYAIPIVLTNWLMWELLRCLPLEQRWLIGGMIAAIVGGIAYASLMWAPR